MSINFPQLMIGVSTQQNSINIIPAVQLGIKSFQFVETQVAKNNRWADGAIELLKNRNITVFPSVVLKPDENGRIDVIQFILSKIVSTRSEGVFFNIGGGQKAQSTAVWEVFKSRMNRNDAVCYTDQSTQNIEIWKWSTEGNLEHISIPINVNLDLKELFGLYGFEVVEDGNQLYSVDGKLEKKNELIDLTVFSDFRQYVNKVYLSLNGKKEQTYTLEEVISFFEPDKPVYSSLLQKIKNQPGLILSEEKDQFTLKFPISASGFVRSMLNTCRSYLKDILHDKSKDEFEFKHLMLLPLLKKWGLSSVLKNNFEDLTSLLQKATGTKGKITWAQYFELLLQYRIIDLLSNSDKHAVSKAYANVKIKRNRDEAEYDIVLITSYGTLLTLDAKTGDFEKKDEDARKHNLLNAAGIYSAFLPVYFFYPEDRDSNTFFTIMSKIKEAKLYGNRIYTYNDCNQENGVVDFEEVVYPIHPIQEILNILIKKS